MMKRGRRVEGKKLARLTAKKLARGARRHDERVKFCADDMARLKRERAEQQAEREKQMAASAALMSPDQAVLLVSEGCALVVEAT